MIQNMLYTILQTYTSDSFTRYGQMQVFTVEDKTVRVGFGEWRLMRTDYAMNTFTGNCNDVLLHIIGRDAEGISGNPAAASEVW